MRKLIFLALSISTLSAETLGSMSETRFREYPISPSKEMVNLINKMWKEEGKKYRITPQEITYRITHEKMSSMYGKFILKCAGYEIPTYVVLSNQDELALTLRKKMTEDQFHVVDSVEHALAYITDEEGIEKSHHELVKFLKPILSKGCTKPNSRDLRITGYHIVLSLWVTRNEKYYRFSSNTITSTRFEELK